jgi:hypothetical protein
MVLCGSLVISGGMAVVFMFKSKVVVLNVFFNKNINTRKSI